MADDQCMLREDGYLNIAIESSSICYHPSLNVIIVFNSANEVKILDVHSGVILGSCKLSDQKKVSVRYLPLQDKVLFWNGENIGMRSDYNGVLLLDTILQTPVLQNDDLVRIDMLLPEAILFQQSFQSLEEHGVECPSDVSNEFKEKIKEAQLCIKKGIKAQRWNTVCIELPYTSLKLVANNLVFNLKRLDRHVPALAIASAINERLTDLLAGSRVLDTGSSGNFQRFLMYSEAARRQTFEKWPHMDYKWALPDQMAQAGFYHQPSDAGEDRAMCFTCSVGLVCWEKTDEPWSEHERHSPNCPFVKGEYTQNVPLSVTYATNPAVPTNGFSVISNSDCSHVLCTSDENGEVNIWSMERQLKKIHSFKIYEQTKSMLFNSVDNCDTSLDCINITAICVLPNSVQLSSNSLFSKSSSTSLKSNIIGTRIIFGVSVKNSDSQSKMYLVVFQIFNNENKTDNCKINDIKTNVSPDKKNETIIPESISEQFSEEQKAEFFAWKANLNTENLGILDDATNMINIASSKLGQDNENEQTKIKASEVGNSSTPIYQNISNFEDITCVPLGYICVEPPLDEMFIISEIFPSQDPNHILVKISKCETNTNEEKDESINEPDIHKTNSEIFSQLSLYALNDKGLIDEQPIASVSHTKDKTLNSICILPLTDNSGRKIGGADSEFGIFSAISEDGALELINIRNLKTLTQLFIKDERFVSVTYCKSLERLCGCTKNGSLIFYSLLENDVDSADEKVEDEHVPIEIPDTPFTVLEHELSQTDGLPDSSKGSSPENSTKLQSSTKHSNTSNNDTPNVSPISALLAHKNDLNLSDLKSLHSLTYFDEMLTCYTAEVPGCWNELVQAQKQRRHSQHLRPGDDTHLIKTWRLHNDATTWDEHIIEITLSKPASLGHIDFKFSLYQQCLNPPAIQITLLKQNTSGFGYRMKMPNSANIGTNAEIDENIEFHLSGNEGLHENLVLCEEYLQAHNAEILAGPMELSNCMDLCDQGGLVVLTSPKLFKTRARNFLLHIKTMTNPVAENQGKTRGCDWLHEISITIRSTKNENTVPNERQQRIAMLESNNFLNNLLKIACGNSIIEQNISLDILIWLCTIRMVRFRSPKTTNKDSPNGIDMKALQQDCVLTIEKHLKNLISKCILNGNRTMAHKAFKLILLIYEGVRNLPNDIEIKRTFDQTLTECIISCLPGIMSSKYSSSVRWFKLLICATSNADSHIPISENCVKLLMDITKQIDSRYNPYYSLLSSRFGLYGYPFEPDIFDIELPPITKGNTNLNTLANIIKSNIGLLQQTGTDLKKLSSIDGVEFRSVPHLIKRKSISNQLRGLLEVEPLHFTCSAASEATRIENIDSLNLNSGGGGGGGGGGGAPSIINMEDVIATPLQKKIDAYNEFKMGKAKEALNDEYILSNVKNMLPEIFNSTHKITSKLIEIKSNGIEKIEKSLPKQCLPKFKAICQYIESCDDYAVSDEVPSSDKKLANKIQRQTNDNNFDENNTIFPWQKLLIPPPNQMVVIERIHSGARRYVVIDFGSPILLTDLVIPACDELASLFIDIWCFKEETDSIRLVVAQDIGVKSLVLSDLQPPPICRYMKITIIGRYGMSATRCKIPIGSFYGHVIILENDAYADPLVDYTKNSSSNIVDQMKSLNSLYEDVHCRYSLSSSKLKELLRPVLYGELSNVAHMQAFINKQKNDENQVDSAKIVHIYEECISLQHQMNIIRNMIARLESSIEPKPITAINQPLEFASRDNLRVLSECLVEILLHFTIEYGVKNTFCLHLFFDMDMANTLFNTLILSGDAHIQLATCSLLVRMCCFQSWWGEFLTNIFCTLYSSQNSKIFAQDRVFFLLTYLGRKSISMGTCRSIVIDEILKTLGKYLAPISPHYIGDSSNSEFPYKGEHASIWSKTDLQLITWLLLFLSVCLDDSPEKKDKSSNRWEFMSCETDFTRSRPQYNSNNGKTLPRCFKKRIIQQNKYNGLQPLGGKKIYMLQNELPEIFMELTGKSKPKIPKPNIAQKSNKEIPTEPENSFDRGLKSSKLGNILVVIRGLLGLILEMDFTCNIDLFLLTCKVIARLVSACRPSIQLSNVITTSQLEQLIRLAVWNDQQQPWAIHAITCLLQDLLNADKHCKGTYDADNNSPEISSIERLIETEENIMETLNSDDGHSQEPNFQVVKDISYADTVKYGQLPSLIECEDAEIDEFLNEIDIIDRGKNLIKKDNITQSKNNSNYYCKSVSNALDGRLDYGLDTNVEISIRRLTLISSLDLYASLPQISVTELINTSAELSPWPEYITNAWSGTEYNCGLQTYEIFINVFDNIFGDLHLQDTWVHLEKVLEIWLTLNSELSETPYNSGLNLKHVPKIPLGPNALQGLLLALAWHGDIKLRTWCLGFQCLMLACNSQSNLDLNEGEINSHKISNIIIEDENFDRMLLRFFSGYGMNSSNVTNRCVGPTICKYVHELLLWLQMKSENLIDQSQNKGKKLKDTLLNLVLHLVQSGGAIYNQQGPIDAQNQLAQHLLYVQYDKTDLNVAMNIIESVSFLVFNNISNVENIYCQKSTDANNSNNSFGSLFATVLGGDNSKQNNPPSDNTLIINLLKLSASLIKTNLNCRLINYNSNSNNEGETEMDEIKAEQFSINDSKVASVADTVLQHFPTMKRLLGSLSHCCSSSFALLATSSLYSTNKTEGANPLNEPQTIADAIFHLLMLLCKKGSEPNLVVTPIYQYLETNSSHRNILPRQQLSEPFLWYVLKVLETPASVEIFTEMGGIKILCQNLVKCNKILMNMQPGLISLIMQHMTSNTKYKVNTNCTGSVHCKKTSPLNYELQDGLINFAPFCGISSENSTAQPADVLIQTPITSHRRARTPAWTYMFYPNESHVDLTITLPTAVLLKEIQLQPHLPTLATCPSAVAVEISRDNGLGPIPFGQQLMTVGMTCIRLKLSKPEIATSIVLRLYRPKDSSSIGLTQITVLGTTIFTNNTRFKGNLNGVPFVDDDSLARTSLGWIRILAQCFSVATFNTNSQLSRLVISSAAEYPGFLEACCALMNVMPLSPNIAMQNLETVLLKLGTHSKNLGVTLVQNLLSGTMPQMYRICNEVVCDLLFNLSTMSDEYSSDRIKVLFDWLLKLHQHFKDGNIRCTNPQSGFVKCIASILWTVHTDELVVNLQDMITSEIFEACFHWIEILENGEPLKISFDSLLCSFCYIKPDIFNNILGKVGITCAQEKNENDQKHNIINNSNKNIQKVGSEILLKFRHKPSYLSTLAMACQSPLAIHQLVNSGVPEILAHAVYEFCCSLSLKIKNSTPTNKNDGTTEENQENQVKINELKENIENIDITQLPDILDFFSECCSEGHMRDWLGSCQGSIFWKPLLELLCNYRPSGCNFEPMEQSFTQIEKSTINFLSCVTSFHPQNQENLIHILISVIQKSQPKNTIKKAIISGFTRRIVLQLLLESEHILVSVKSKIPLQKKDHSMSLVNNHPSKRSSSYNLFFYLSSHTKCQDILQNCISVYSNILPTFGSELHSTDPSSSNISTNNQSDNRREMFEMGLGLGGHGMEFLSVVAGVNAKDKRLKDVKNQAALLNENLFPNLTRTNQSNIANSFQLMHSDFDDLILSTDTTISQILSMLQNRGVCLSTPCIPLELTSTENNDDFINDLWKQSNNVEPLPSPLQIFSNRGGLSLLAHYLPTVYPDNSKLILLQPDKEKNPFVNEWVKIEPNDEIYEDLEDAITETSNKTPAITSVPQHSLAAFGLFLRLPSYSDVLLRDKLPAQCLLRLVLGVTEDGEGNDIYSLPLASSLPTLPFEVFRQLLDMSTLKTEEGISLRRMVIEVGAMNLVLNCLGIFTHQSQNYQILGPQIDLSNNNTKNLPNVEEPQLIPDEKSHFYWAKGTGFGTGSTQQSWDVEQALLRQKSEEEHVTVLLQVISSYINPRGELQNNLSSDEILNCDEIKERTVEDLPPIFLTLLQKSCLIPALSSYLRNDSVLDITRHIPLYRSILQLLRAIALSNQLVVLLKPFENTGPNMSIASLLSNMKACVDTYAKRLKVNKKSNIKGQTQKITVNLDDGDDEGLALLIPDIKETSMLVQKAINIETEHSENESEMSIHRPISTSIEQRYLEVMKKLQFDTYEMIVECENGYRFITSHHFENNVRMAGDRGHPSRVKRLAQETVTLSTSLPLSYSSSVFVRCDTDRLDIMKVLITGPAETPYANGCFEFDVYFPPDYPNAPMLINLETTGRHSVRFNPNLYNDGKVCLSVLNTWHGRPEEKWNAQTSSFLQVLVSIQSLILVPEPYFNEPGFERSRGTPSGTHCSREYNSNIYQACVRWAMLEQIRNPNPSFKEVIHTHFWLKRHEICTQIESWIEELSKPQYSERSGRTISFNSMVLRRQYRQLREELGKLTAPEGLEDLDRPFNPNISSINTMADTINTMADTINTSDSPPTSAVKQIFSAPSLTICSFEAEDADESADIIITAQNDDIASWEFEPDHLLDSISENES